MATGNPVVGKNMLRISAAPQFFFFFFVVGRVCFSKLFQSAPDQYSEPI